MAPSILIILFSLFFLALFFVYNLKWLHFKSVNTTSFLFLYYFIAGILSLVFYNISDGIFRNFDNLKAIPFVYLAICIVISFYPIYKYDKFTYEVVLTKKQFEVIDILCIFLGLISILPLIESVIQLPSSLASEQSIADAYARRQAGLNLNFHSALGEKLNWIIYLFSLLTPCLLMVQITKRKVNVPILLGLISCFLNVAINNMIIGGRSSSMQDMLYMITVFLLFKNSIPQKRQAKIKIAGLFLLLSFVISIMIVSISRYVNSNVLYYNNVFESMSLYAGEGFLNFNNDLWYITKNSDGYKTMGLIISIIEGEKVDAATIWAAGEKTGVLGNVFYTYVGSIFMDYGKAVTFGLITFFSILFSKLFKKHNRISFFKFVLMCAWAKILVVGPIFYAYTTTDSQISLLLCFLLGFILNIQSNKNDRIKQNFNYYPRI